MATEKVALTFGHSPDADDVFMWWPITGMIDPLDTSRTVRPPVLDTGHLRFLAAPSDIEALNRRAAECGDLDITAISMHTYPHVKTRYSLTACGSSMGDGYGPKVVARPDQGGGSPTDRLAEIAHGRALIAVPGERTTAFLALSLMLGAVPARRSQVLFSRIIDAVTSAEADAGLVIHEGQLTYQDHGLVELADLGAWWNGRTGLPLPLGGNVVRRDLDDRLGRGTTREVVRLLEASIRYAMEHHAESIEYAAGFAPGVAPELIDRFVGMYVNQLTLDAGERGRRAIGGLLREGFQRGLCPDPGEVELLRAG